LAQKKAVEAVWELTRPRDDFWAGEYRAALDRVVLLPKPKRFRRSFYVDKASGGQRLIVPAGEDLRLVQGVLANWIIKEFPPSSDYCYTGLGVLAAVKRHQRSKFAVVFDLKDAFDQVTAARITHWLQFYRPGVAEAVVTLIVDLLTINGRAPQGCVSTPYVFNLVARPLDQGLEIVREEFGLNGVTRYSDNVCLSSSRPFDFEALEGQVQRFVRGSGFAVSWSRRFADEPIVYLGTRIYDGRLSLAEEKYGEFCDRLLEAIQSPTPQIYRAQVTGIFNWAHRVCGAEIPMDLLELLARYFGKVGRTPQPLAAILAQKRMRRMF